MNAVAPALVSIWLLAALAWLARRTLRVSVCPVCAGVAGTWLWMLVAREFGIGVDTSLLPLLLAGSVVGIAYQLERFVPAGRSAALFKSIAIPIGLAAAYALEQSQWGLLLAMLVALAVVGAAFFRAAGEAAPASEAVEELKKQMKQCC